MQSQPWSWRTALAERAASADPGSLRLRFALSGALAIGLAIGAEYLFVHATGALQIAVPAGAPDLVVAHLRQINHIFVVLAELLGVTVALCATLSAVEPSPREQLTTLAFIPLPMVAGLSAAVALSPYRLAGLIAGVVAIGVAGYARSYGPRGMTAGTALFLGFFAGATIGSTISTGQLGWPAAEIGVGFLVVVLVKLVIFRPDPNAAVRRMNASFAARVTDILVLTEDTLTTGDAALVRRLHRHLRRHNQAGLMLDAALSHAGGGATPVRLANERIFDVEHVLDDLGHRAELVAGLAVPTGLRATLRLAVLAIRHGDLYGARVLAQELLTAAERGSGRHAAPGEDTALAGLPDDVSTNIAHLARAVLHTTEVIEAWRVATPEQSPGQLFPPPALIAGWLPGTAIVSARASVGAGPRSGYAHLRLGAPVRAAIQMTVAGALAVVVGDAVSGPHYVWALLTVFLLFMGPVNAADQVSKSLLRLLGTVLGIVVVVVVVHVTGDDAATAVTITVGCAFVALYLARINPAFMVFGLTVMLSQLFVQLQQYNDALLRLRIEEVGVGAASVIVTALLVVPLHYQRVVQVALQGYLSAVSELLGAVGPAFTSAADGAGPDRIEARQRAVAAQVKPLVRRLDLAYQSLLATVDPPTRPSFGSANRRARTISAFADRSRRDVRLVASGLRGLRELNGPGRTALSASSRALAESVGTISAYLGGDRGRSYPRTGPAPALSTAAGTGRHTADMRQRPTSGLSAATVAGGLRAADDTFAGLAALLGMPVDPAAPVESRRDAARPGAPLPT